MWPTCLPKTASGDNQIKPHESNIEAHPYAQENLKAIWGNRPIKAHKINMS